MQATQDRQGEDLAIISMWRDKLTIPLWDLLSNALMRSDLIEVLGIGMQDTIQLLLLQDEQVIETLATHTAEEALADGIGTWSMIGRFENFDATGLGNPREGHAKFAIVIPDEIFRPHTKGGGEPSLLRRPSIRGRACHADVNHFARVQEGVEEGEQRAEEEIGHGQEIARPDLLGMGV